MIAAADLHITYKRPQYRIDNYFNSICIKLNQIVILCNNYDADLVLAGDIFDSATVGHKVVNAVMVILRKLKKCAYVIAGQHDQLNHLEKLTDTAFRTLLFNEHIKLLTPNKPYVIAAHGTSYNMYGCSFGQIPKEHVTANSILVIHRSITPEKPPFFLTDAISAKEASKLYGIMI